MTINYNFSAGPAMLPIGILQDVQQQLINWQGSGRSVMELSHRSAEFMDIAQQSEKDLRELMNIPDTYHVLFCHGGGSGQFSAVPLNLIKKSQTADYIVRGHWSKYAADETSKYCHVNNIDITHQYQGKEALLPASHWPLSKQAEYLFLCPNETINGMEIRALPKTDKIIVADMSSSILSRPIDVTQYGIIYAGAQKNIGPAGLTLVIVRDDLLGKVTHAIPTIFDYQALAEKASMVNTPPTFAWYVAGQVFKWLKNIGGIDVMFQKNMQKAALLYDVIDQSSLYINHIDSGNRSIMNVPFTLINPEMTTTFLQQAEAAGLKALNGHASVGGVRASIYNAMPLQGVQALVTFMQDFENKNT